MEFAYPDDGGYDSISHVLADYIVEQNGHIQTSQSVKKIIIENSKSYRNYHWRRNPNSYKLCCCFLILLIWH